MKSRRNRELYRIPKKGKVAGVCAGVAEYFGWEAWLIRVLVVSGVLFGMPWLVMIYIAGWFILDKQPVNTAHSTAQGQANEASAQAVNTAADEPIKVKARIWQAGEPPRQAFHDIRRKFQSLERQLQSMERYVTSPEFTVSREINRL